MAKLARIGSQYPVVISVLCFRASNKLHSHFHGAYIMFSLNIYFLGQYRPIYFNGKNLAEVCKSARRSISSCEDAEKLIYWINDLSKTIHTHENYARVSREHGAIGVCIRRGEPVDLGPMLTEYMNGLPHYPRAIYDAVDVPSF